jgi:hypothetical protein
MYKYLYRNIKSGASVFSHKPLDRENLELVRKIDTPTIYKTTQQTESITKPVRAQKPKTIRRKRKK